MSLEKDSNNYYSIARGRRTFGMKLLLINAHYGSREQSEIGVPLTMYHIGSILEKENYEVEILELMLYGMSSDKVLKSKAECADVVLFTSNTFSWSYVLEEIKYLRRCNYSGLVIVGGIHPSIAYEHILKTYSQLINYIVLGEAEDALPQLLKHIKAECQISDVPNIAYVDDDGTINVTVRKTHDLLQSEYTPLYDKIPESFYKSITYESSRGCKCHCGFCSITYQNCWRFYQNEFNDYKMGVLIDKMNTKKISQNKTIIFTDDCFTTVPERATNLLNLFEVKYSLSNYSIQFEARAIDLIRSTHLINAIQKYPKITVQVGIESGYDDGWVRINKPMRYRILIQLCELLNEQKLTDNVYLSFIIGFPFETMEDCKRTISTIKYIWEKYGVISSIAWWIPLPSECFNLLMQNDRNLSYSIFDKPNWMNEKDMFYLTHPFITREGHYEFSNELEKITDLLVKNGWWAHN